MMQRLRTRIGQREAQTLHDTMNAENDSEKSRRKLSRAIINCARRSLAFRINQKTIINI